MSIVYISDFDLDSTANSPVSGYANIGIELCNHLAQAGHKVIALGLGYKGNEHWHLFTIAPARLGDMATIVQYLLNSGIEIEAIIVALDVPLQEMLLDKLGIPSDIPYIGLFPLESDPVCQSWAINISRMNEVLIMSRFGQKELKLAGVDSTFIPIGIDHKAWRPTQYEEREKIRQQLGITDGQFVVLTVADNQERKNLSRSMEIFSDFATGFDVNYVLTGLDLHKPKPINAIYWMVTRPNAQVGWKLNDYAIELGISDKFVPWNRGMSQQQLWSLYAAADVMLLTSKAEGLAMPVLEAMSCRLPVIGTNCAAIKEHLDDGRGLLIDIDYEMIDPWGNSRRYFASREDGAYKLKLWHTGMSNADCEIMLNKAQAYANERLWGKAGDVLINVVRGLIKPAEAIVESESELELEMVAA